MLSSSEIPRQSQPSSSLTSGPVVEHHMYLQLVKLLEEVKDTQRVHTRILNNILKQKDEVPVLTVPEGAVFPLKTVEDLEAMCGRLRDPEFFSAVVSSSLIFTYIHMKMYLLFT